MANELVQLTIDFRKEYNDAARDIAAAILMGGVVTNKLIEDRVIKVMTPIINELFISGIAATNQIVKEGVARLVVDHNIPFKYNKDLLIKLNDTSIFTGYYDRTFKGVYSKTEINRLKNTILSAKYGGWSETRTITAIRNTASITAKRAMLLARNETARLTSVTNQIYFSRKVVQNKFDLVWFNTPGNIRPDHAAMAGKKADKNGMFQSAKCGLVPGPPLACDPYNCKCFSQLVDR